MTTHYRTLDNEPSEERVTAKDEAVRILKLAEERVADEKIDQAQALLTIADRYIVLDNHKISGPSIPSLANRPRFQ